MKKVGRGWARTLVVGLIASTGFFISHQALASAPVEDTFDALGYQGWQTYGGSAVPFTQVSDGCVSGDCLRSTVSQIPRIYKTGDALSEGNITVYIRFHIGWAFFGMGNTVQLCTGAPQIPNPTNCDVWQQFASNDDQWHQYLFAWRDKAGHKEVCTRRDDIDVGHCSWTISSVHNEGDLLDTVVLAGEFGGRPDLGDLLWFDELGTSNLNSSAASSVLFLPGIQASRLYRTGDGGLEYRLWEPHANADVQDLYMNPDGSSVRADIYTKIGDVIDEVSLTGTNIYKSFIAQMNTLRDDDTIADWEAVPYDWRLSLDDILNYGHEVDGRIYYSGSLRATSTPYIIQELKRLALNSKTGKVTIVAHSNGGLVTKRLIEKLGPDAANLIDNVIFVAVPQTGTPKALAALMHGEGQSILGGIILSSANARGFGKNAPLAYQLLPSRAYFSSPASDVTMSPVSFLSGTSTNLFTNFYGSAISTFGALSNFVVGVEGRPDPGFSNVSYPQLGNQTLFSAADSLHSDIDNWIPPSSIHVYQIAGWGEDTIGSISYRQGGFFHCLFSNPCLDEEFPKFIDGDGTVVTPSALAMSTSSQNVSRYWLNIGQFNKDNRLSIPSGYTHASILEVPELLGFVNSIISSTNTSSFQYLSTNLPSSANLEKRLRFFLHSPLTLELYDQVGHHLGVSTTTSIVENTIPGAKYEEIGELKFASIPSNVPITLFMSGQASGGFTLKIEEAEGSEISASATFADIPSETSTTVTMNFSEGSILGAGPLSVDTDGNGSVDYVLPEKLNGIASISYLWKGFLQPINDTGYHPELSRSVFKAGSTVPVKFQLKTLDGKVTQGKSLPIWISPEQQTPLGTAPNEPISSSNASTGSTYRWDPTIQQYIYNWSTKGLQAGYWYKIYAKLDDGMIYSTIIGLR